MTHEQLIARAKRYGLLTREENGGLLLWWPDEDLNQFMPLSWDTVAHWLDCYAEEGAKARGITVKPEQASRSKAQPVAVNQLPLFGGL